MWAFVKRFLAKSRLLNQTLGDVVFETAEIKGASSHSFFQWRIKESVEGGQYFVGLAMRPDAYAGPDGSPTNYMNFDIAVAQQLKSDLDRCISEYYRLMSSSSARNT